MLKRPAYKQKGSKGVKKQRLSAAEMNAFRAMAAAPRAAQPRRGVLGMETKYFDTSRTSGTIPAPTDATGGEFSPSTILCLNGVPQGDTAQSRDGGKISMKSIYINGLVSIPSQSAQSAADVMSSIYIALVLDTQTNGGTATGIDSEQVFSNPGANALLAACPLRNMSYTERYKVLKAVKLEVPMLPLVNDTGATGGVVQVGVTIPWEISYNLKGLQTKFQAGTTSGYIGTIVDNSLHVIAFSSNTGVSPTLLYNARLRYHG